MYFVFCHGLSLVVALTLCWPHIQGGPPLCICLVFWSTISCSPYSLYRHVTHGHLGCIFQGCKSYIVGRINNRERKEEWYEIKGKVHIARTFSRLMSNILIWERFISISSRFQMTDNNTFLAISPADLITYQQKQLTMFVKFHVCHSARFLVSYMNYP